MNTFIKKASLLFILLLGIYSILNAQAGTIRIVVFGAHPDDCESDAGGTAALWAEMGHQVKFVSLTNGDAGHFKIKGPELAKRRYAEAQEAAKRLGIAKYVVLDNHDGELLPSLEVRRQVIREIRNWQADVVILPRSNDYHPDHRNTGLVIQDAAYMVIVPNIVPDTPPLKKNPVFLYAQDYFQKPNPFKPHIAVAIDRVYDKKILGMDAHVSQFYEWLPWTSQRLNDVPKGKEARREWLGELRYRPIIPEVRFNLRRWYKGGQSEKVKHAEAFEICEYGRQPDDAEIKRLFPMLGKM